MINENEIVMLLIGLGCLLFVIVNHEKVVRITQWKILLAGFCLTLAGWLVTVAEGFFWGDLLNYIEHICYLAGALFVALWFWMTSGKTDGPRD